MDTFFTQSEIVRRSGRCKQTVTARIDAGAIKPDGVLIATGKEHLIFRATRWPEIAKTLGISTEPGVRAVRSIIALLLASALALSAQAPREYELIGGGTNRLTATATNAPLYLACSEYDEVTFRATANGHSGTPSNVQFYVYRSIDSSSYEGTNWATVQLQLSGTTTNTSITEIDVGGAAVLKIVPANTNAVVVTNLMLRARFKASKVRAIQ